MMLDLDGVEKDWRPPILKAIASQNIGIAEVVATFQKHYDYIRSTGELTARRTERTKNEMLDLLDGRIGSYVRSKIVDNGKLDAYVEDIKARKTDPYTVVGGIMQDMLK